MVLEFINKQMFAIGIPYEFGEWSEEVAYPYFVGEISEDEPTTEDGAETATFILTGFNRGGYITLEEARKRIKDHFDTINGLRAKTEEGAIAVFYGGAFNIPTGEADLKKIQINLKIKTWKGAI
jgi:hypothetical protein